ncbi:hypothetical protein FACS1894127_1630 [Clostridia bacterium]|nr:hypothetical protein FACS1894127_1630 [Clostridia bacterium]
MTSISNAHILPLFIVIFLVIAIILFIVLYTSDRKKAKQLADKRVAKQQANRNNHPQSQPMPGSPKSASAPQASSSNGVSSPVVTKAPAQNQGQPKPEVEVVPLAVPTQPKPEAIPEPPVAAVEPQPADPSPATVSKTPADRATASKTPADQAIGGTGNKFYVFVTQGRSFASGGSSPEDAAKDKAQKLKADYPPAADLELVIVSPGTWENPGTKTSAGNVAMADIAATGKAATISSDEAIKEYLIAKGLPVDVIEAGLKVSAEASLKLTNLGTGLSLVGIPIT